MILTEHPNCQEWVQLFHELLERDKKIEELVKALRSIDIQYYELLKKIDLNEVKDMGAVAVLLTTIACALDRTKINKV